MFFDQLDSILTARHPLTWIVTEEQYRITNHLARTSHRDVYALSATTGLNMWQNNRWVAVFEENHPEVDENGEPLVPPAIRGLPASLDYVTRHGGIFVVPQAHLYAEKMVEYLASTHDDWLSAFYSDDLEDMVVSIVMLSHKDEVPPEVATVTTKITPELPDLDTLVGIVDHIVTHTNDDDTTDEYKRKVARAGQGLSEPAFVSAVTRSLAKHHQLDHEFVNRLKVETIGGAGILKIRRPGVTIDEVGGMDHAKKILSMTANMWSNPERTKALGVKPIARIILCGISGTGKSRLCEAAATALGLDLAEFSVSQAMNKFVGESERQMRQVFTQINALRPIVLWTDELGRDLSGGASSSVVDGGTTSRVHGAFLQGMQELPDDVFWVAAANDLSDLPPEMLRSGRIDQLLFVGFPTHDERKEIFKIHLGESHTDYDIDLLAARTALFTGAEIESLIKMTNFYVIGERMSKPTTADFVEFAPKLKNRQWRLHKPAIVAMYERAIKEWDWASTAQYDEAGKVLDAAVKKPRSRASIPNAAAGV